MTKADDFRPDDQFQEDPSFFQEKIDQLTSKLAAKEKEILEKDRLLEAYWNTIQSMRIVNRLKSLMGPWRHKSDSCITNFKMANAPSLKWKRNGLRICIKMPVYNWKVADTWGDFYFSLGLKKQLVKLGYDVIVQTLDEWHNDHDRDCQVILVLRGLSKYEPRSKALHLMWNISHPDKVTIEEYNSYDHVFIASKMWADEIRSRIGDKVSCLLQCTDPDIFRKSLFPIKSEILFVGNSKGILRPILKDLLPTEIDLKVYGHDWENIIDKKYIKGKFINHHKLYKYYSGTKILLNDHWEDMRRYGFVSNRVFDALMSGSFIISDRVNGMNQLFGSGVVTYQSPGELRDKIHYYLQHSAERSKISDIGNDLVLRKHDFRQRAVDIDRIIRANIS